MSDKWTEKIFNSDTAKSGGVVRRSVKDINRTGNRWQIISECKRRGFHIVENGGQWIIICNRGDFRTVC